MAAAKLAPNLPQWMIDHANRLIAVYDGKSGGGTGYSVGFAEKIGVEIIYLNPDMFLHIK